MTMNSNQEEAETDHGLAEQHEQMSPTLAIIMASLAVALAWCFKSYSIFKRAGSPAHQISIDESREHRNLLGAFQLIYKETLIC